MPLDELYRQQAGLLVKIVPFVARETSFALKGGTAIDKPVTLDELLQVREELIREMVGKMPTQHRQFLISVKRGEPNWTLLACLT